MSSLVDLGKPFLARARSSLCHTCETRHSDPSPPSPPLLPRTELSLSSPQIELCKRCRQRLGNCDVLVENPQPSFKTLQSGQSLGRFVRAAPLRLQRQTQHLCMLGQGIIGQELGQHISRVLQSPDIPSSSSSFLHRVLNPQVLQLVYVGLCLQVLACTRSRERP